MDVAERIRQQTEQLSIESDKGKITLTASFGVCSVKEYHDIEVAISKADQAMFQAKSTGRNLVRTSQIIISEFAS